MAPPSVKPRLSFLSAESVALEVAIAAFRHTQSLVQALLAPAYEGVPEGPEMEALCRQTRVYDAVLALAVYAISGRGAGQAVLTNAASLLRAMRSSVIDDGTPDDEDSLRSPSVDTPLGVVLCAARARAQLEQDLPVTAMQLGVLAGLSAPHVRLLNRAGELAMCNGQAAAGVGRRWLAERGVPGFDRATVSRARPEAASAGLSA